MLNPLTGTEAPRRNVKNIFEMEGQYEKAK